MTEAYETARGIIRTMLTPENVKHMEAEPSGRFGGEFANLAFQNVYVPLWTRPGLGLKERSLVTIGILIALGNTKELSAHFASALRNGLTVQELEEVVYHSTAYAGFPAASGALAVAAEVVARETGDSEAHRSASGAADSSAQGAGQ